MVIVKNIGWVYLEL